MAKYIIQIDLSNHEDLYRKLTEIAQKELRSVNNQLIYWLLQNIDNYMGFKKGEKQ